jgi:hypothetical protein
MLLPFETFLYNVYLTKYENNILSWNSVMSALFISFEIVQ